MRDSWTSFAVFCIILRWFFLRSPWSLILHTSGWASAASNDVPPPGTTSQSWSLLEDLGKSLCTHYLVWKNSLWKTWIWSVIGHHRHSSPVLWAGVWWKDWLAKLTSHDLITCCVNKHGAGTQQGPPCSQQGKIDHLLLNFVRYYNLM